MSVVSGVDGWVMHMIWCKQYQCTGSYMIGKVTKRHYIYVNLVLQFAKDVLPLPPWILNCVIDATEVVSVVYGSVSFTRIMNT
jgi:hypothetical protein